MTQPIYGAATKLGIGTTSTVNQRLDFEECGVVLAESMPYLGGLRGTRERDVSRVVQGNRRAGGPIRLPGPTAVEWSYLLPWILGATASGTTYAVAEALPYRYVTVARDNAAFGGTDGKVFTYDHCLVNNARFRSVYSPEGGALTLDLDVVGVDEAIGNNGTFPAISLDTTTAPFLHTDSSGAVSIAGSAYPCQSVAIDFENHLDTQRFFNSQTLSAVYNAMDRTIGVTLEVPYAGAEALYGTGAAGVAVTITYTSGLTATSLVFTFVKVVFPRDTPPTRGRTEGFLTLRGQAYHSGATNALVCTLDSTP